MTPGEIPTKVVLNFGYFQINNTKKQMTRMENTGVLVEYLGTQPIPEVEDMENVTVRYQLIINYIPMSWN